MDILSGSMVSPSQAPAYRHRQQELLIIKELSAWGPPFQGQLAVYGHVYYSALKLLQSLSGGGPIH